MKTRTTIAILSSATLLTIAACSEPPEAPAETEVPVTVQFENITEAAGLGTPPSWKYGGPTVADLNMDGHYDFILGSHHVEPAELYWGQDGVAYRKHSDPIATGDIHGIAAGDFDQDHDVDLLVSKGGGNGTTPQPPRMLRNDGGVFTDVTVEAGISELGARGRSVRWVDFDLDGDLDFFQINARQLITESGPRNIVFENLGGGEFEYRESPGFEQVEAERVLVVDIDGDRYQDFVMFEPLSVWRGNGGFTFDDVTAEVLPEGFGHHELITAAAAPDIDNDGDPDLYLSRGNTYYQVANNSIAFDEDSGRLDLRDEGNAGQDGLSFTAAGPVTLRKFWHWPRGVELTLPVYLGANQVRMDTPVEGLAVDPANAEGFPGELTENGWYLGHLGDGEWRFAWLLKGNLAWDIRATIEGVERVAPDWEPQNYNDVPDVLLRNEGGVYSDASSLLPPETEFSNWGITHADFDNDGDEDLFVYRFGELSKRLPDVLLLNQGDAGFEAMLDHGANVLGTEAHGDMGAAFDHNLDGKVDLLNGDDDQGRWYLYENQTELGDLGRYLLVDVGYSQAGIDPMSAVVTVERPGGLKQTKTIGSAGSVHSQSQLSIMHFGVGATEDGVSVSVRWRDGSISRLADLETNQRVKIGSFSKTDDPE